METHHLLLMLLLATSLISCEGGDILFKDDFSGNLDHWFLEGTGKASITKDGMLCVETKTPTVIWIKTKFPGDVRIDFDAKTDDAKARAILMFLAESTKQDTIFDWERKGDYCEYAFDERIALYTIGMLRGFTKGESNLRKLGGNLKPEWKKLAIRDRDKISKEERKRINADFQKGSIMSGAMDGCDLGKVHHITCVKKGSRIRYSVDGKLVHDVADDGSFGGTPVENGWIGFRNFGKGTKVFYDNVVVTAVK